MFDQLAGLFVHNLQLQKSPCRIFGQNSGNSVDISKVFFEIVIWKFESSQVELPNAMANSEWCRRPLVLEVQPLDQGLVRDGRSRRRNVWKSSQHCAYDAARYAQRFDFFSHI